MNENEEQVINLGQNLGGIAPQPVYSPIMGGTNVFTSGYAQTTAITSAEPVIVKAPEVNGDMYNMHSQVVSEEVSTEEKNIAKVDIVEPKVIRGEVVIPTNFMKSKLALVRKVGVSNNLHAESEVLNVDINKDGILMRASNREQDLEWLDTSYLFPDQDMHFAVDIKLFGELFNALSCASVILRYDSTTQILTVVTASGEYKFAPKIDLSRGVVVENKLQFDVADNLMVPVDYQQLVSIIDYTKTARVSAKKTNRSYLDGIYCHDIVLATDGQLIITIQKNLFEKSNKEYFINSDLCNLLSTIHFNPTTFKMGFVESAGVVRGLVFSDGSIKICGSSVIDARVPSNIANIYWNSTDFINKITINKQAFINTLKTVMLFSNNVERADMLIMTVTGGFLNISAENGAAKDIVSIVNPSNVSIQREMKIPSAKLLALLQIIKSDTISVAFREDASNCFCIEYDGQKSIVSLFEN